MVVINHIGRYVLETLETTGRLVFFFAMVIIFIVFYHVETWYLPNNKTPPSG